MRPFSGQQVVFAALLACCAACTDHLQKGADAYQQKNFSSAIQELRPLADKGDAEAQLYMGVMYDNGEGVPLDYRLAVEWYTKSAEQGNANAQYNLGMMYGGGFGVPQDWVQALKWFNLSAIGGHKEAVDAGATAESKMTPEQIKQAWALSDQWQAK